MYSQGLFLHTGTLIYWLSQTGNGFYRVHLYIWRHRYTGCHTVVVACTGFDLVYRATDILAVKLW